jgi:hypothetical protein
MRKTDFENFFCDVLTHEQMAGLETMSYGYFEDAHGYKPETVGERNISHDFMVDFLADCTAAELYKMLKCIRVTPWQALQIYKLYEEDKNND